MLLAGCCWLLMEIPKIPCLQLRLILFFLVTAIFLLYFGVLVVAEWLWLLSEVIDCKTRWCMIQNNNSLRRRLFEEVETHWKSG
jgi:hypothetical protein